MGMFEFGKDLRRLFAQARESDDLGWLELIGVELLEGEAQRQAVDAGRVGCDRPGEAGLRAARLWREHARRTGRLSSLDKAMRAADGVARAEGGGEARLLAGLEGARGLLLRFDLCGGPERLAQAARRLEADFAPRRSRAVAEAAGVHAALKARQARLSGDVATMMDAAALLDAALHGREAAGDAPDLMLDRAALALEAGIARRDPRLLDLAGRDLRRLVESASSDERPLTRARALSLCGAGLRALAALAGDAVASRQGRAMFEAAADQFTYDHSPLDWAAVRLAAGEDASLEHLRQAEALCRGGAHTGGLVLGAQARLARVQREARLAEASGDLAELSRIEARLQERVALGDAGAAPVDWAADQIGLVHVGLARQRLTGAAPRSIGLMLCEAAQTAREQGAPALAAKAEAMLHPPSDESIIGSD